MDNFTGMDEATLETLDKLLLEVMSSMGLKIVETKDYQANAKIMDQLRNLHYLDEQIKAETKLMDSLLPVLGISLPSLKRRDILIMLACISLLVILVLSVKHLRFRQQKQKQSPLVEGEKSNQNIAAVEHIEPKQFWNSRLSWISRIVKINRGGAVMALEEIDPSSLTDFEFQKIVKSIPVSPDLVREIIDLRVNHPNLFLERIQDLRIHIHSIANPTPKPILKRLIGKIKSSKKIGSWIKNRPAAIKNKFVQLKISKPKFLKNISTFKEIKLSDELIAVLLAILMILTIASGNALPANRGSRLRRQELDSNESVYSPISTLTSSEESTLFHSRKSTHTIESSQQVKLNEEVTEFKSIPQTKEMAPSASKKARTKPKKRGKTVGLSDLPPMPNKVSETIDYEETTYNNNAQNRIPMRIRNIDRDIE